MDSIPVEGEIVVRSIPFEFPDGLRPVWSPGTGILTVIWGVATIAVRSPATARSER